jgi:hypothetical protein
MNDIRNFSGLTEQWYESCDLIGELFLSLIVKRALWELWNNNCELWEELKKSGSFDIHIPEYLSFLRLVATDDDKIQQFLINIREIAIEVRDAWKLKYQYQHITTFILLWEDIIYRLKHSTESMWAILSDSVKDSIYSAWEATAFIIGEEQNSCTKFQAINSLTTSWVSPVDENGYVLYLVNDFWEFHGFYEVVNKIGQKYYVDKDGVIIEWEDLDQKRIEGSNEMIRLYQDCLFLIKWEEPIHFPKMRVLREVTSLELNVESDGWEDIQIAITEFEGRIQDLRVSNWRVQFQVIDWDWK